MNKRIIERLDESRFHHGIQFLQKKDNDLKRVVERYGPPPMWLRPPGFPTLVRIILEQQVSLRSAEATFEKLQNFIKRITPENVLSLDDNQMLSLGFSRQKRDYVRVLAETIIENGFDLEMQSGSAENLRKSLLRIKGIGPWTVSIYMLMALALPDEWPTGDLALKKALQQVKGLGSIPSNEEAGHIAENWHPYRAVAARILWHHYLSVIGK